MAPGGDSIDLAVAGNVAAPPSLFPAGTLLSFKEPLLNRKGRLLHGIPPVHRRIGTLKKVLILDSYFSQVPRLMDFDNKRAHFRARILVRERPVSTPPAETAQTRIDPSRRETRQEATLCTR